MKTKKQKILAMLVVAVMCLQYIVPITALAAKSVYVEHKWMMETDCFGYPETHGPGTKVLVGKDNPKVGFCVEPGVPYSNGTHHEITPESIGLTESKLNRLTLIAWYGYRSREHNNTNYSLTQSLIWKELGSKKRIGIGSYTSEADMKPWFDNVLDKVDNFHKLPSFDGKTYTVNAGDTLEIKDSKKVLSGLKIENVTGGKAKIDGNTLVVTPNGKADKMLIEFNRGMSTAQTETNFVLKVGDSQAVSCLTGKDPYGAYVNIKVNLFGELVLNKYNDDRSALVPNTTFKITGPDGYSKTHTTNASGKIKIDELLPGTYKAVETKAAPGYLLDDTVHTFKIEPSEKTTLNIENDEPKGTISVTKEDTYGNKLKGGQFQIIAASDIKNKAGKTTYYTKGEVVETITTGADGIAESKKLPLGKYQVKELHAPDGYLLNLL